MRYLILLFLFFFGHIHSAVSQKVALVLSGGGSKGIAHLGVIKALEENNIPIDYIIGTSMGGVVGGFYAAGYSIDELEKIVLSDDLQNWVSGRIDEKYRYHLYQREPNASILSLKISLDSLFKISLKNTIIKDYSINFALAELLSRASSAANCNFDSLFVPFRCLAADIFTQETIVMKDGNLNDAVRATLNVPLFFKPVKVQGKYLFDGGLYNNFPADEAMKEFKPDIIIGVNVSSKTFLEYPYEDDESLIKDALLYMFLSNSDSSSVGKNGIYIQPKLGNYSVVDFSEAKRFLDIGYEEAMLKMDSIKAKVSRRLDSSTLNERRRKFKAKEPEFRFADVQILGLKPYQKKYVQNMFPYNPSRLNLEIIRKRYFRLAETEKFEVLYPSFVYNPSNNKLDFNLLVKPDKSIRAEIGGNLASRNISTLYMGLEYDYVRTLLYTFSGNFYFGRFYSSTNLHLRIGIPTKNPIYLEPYFNYNDWSFLNANELFFNREQTILLQNDTDFGLNLGVAAGKRSKLIFSFAFFRNNDRYSNTPSITANGALDLTRFEGQVLGVEFSQDRRNRKQFASKGSSFLVSGKYISGTEYHTPGTSSIFSGDYSQYHEWIKLKISTEKYFNVRAYSFGVFAEGVFSTQPAFRNYTSTLIASPAFYPLLDSKTLFLTEYRSFIYATVGIKNILNLFNNIDLQTAFYAFNAYEPVKEGDQQSTVFNKGEFDLLRLSATTSLVYHSRLGPISLSVNYYNNEKTKLGFLFNAGFLLFNKRALD